MCITECDEVSTATCLLIYHITPIYSVSLLRLYFLQKIYYNQLPHCSEVDLVESMGVCWGIRVDIKWYR